jgi:FtsH-binding integral membrane protein
MAPRKLSAGTFDVMSIYGYTTKSGLSKWGNILFVGLIGIVIASITNIFMQSTALYWITTYVGILVFVGLTDYDTQRIKESAVIGTDDTEAESKTAIMGALTLYLDFINLFLKPDYSIRVVVAAHLRPPKITLRSRHRFGYRSAPRNRQARSAWL